MYRKVRGQSGFEVGLAILGLCALVGIVYFTWSFFASRVQIEPGNVGVKFNRATGQLISLEGPGWKTIDPWRESVIEYPVVERSYVMLSQEDGGANDSVRVIDNEGQAINLGVVVQHAVIAECAGDLFKRFGPIPIEEVENRFVRQESRSAVTGVASAYGWEQIVSTERGTITGKVFERLEPRFAERCLRLIGVEIREVVLPPALEERIAAKIAAQQEIQQRQFEAERAQVDGDIARTQAQADADARRLRADAAAYEVLTAAQAQAEANRLLAESLSPDLVQYIQANKWDGKLPAVQGDQVTPFVDMRPVDPTPVPVAPAQPNP